MTETTFTEDDVRQMRALGISPDEARRHVELFRHPPDPVRLDRPARVGDGIVRLPEDSHGPLIQRFERARGEGRISKLVPASGAATRMFRDLLADLNGGGTSRTETTDRFFDDVRKFAFYPQLARTYEELEDEPLDDALERGTPAVRKRVLEVLLTGRGLGYADLPKGLIPFHRYPTGSATPFEEHLVEAAAYARDQDKIARLHFTVAPEHEERFRAVLGDVGEALGDRLDCRFDVIFSSQSHATDTLAVDLDDRPFRLDDGTLLFRPGGHGALLGNLEATRGDLVMVKNIDNVVPNGRKDLVHWHKKVLGGYLLVIRDRAFGFLERLERDDAPADPALLDESTLFVRDSLKRPLPDDWEGREPDAQRSWLIEALDRPLRACGVVVNQGEPGGGPFWVRGEDGSHSLQIVEGSQVGDDEGQEKIFASSTHFNPVDLACSLRNHRGDPYALEDYVDPSSVFIAEKTHQGRPLKALERPGLWNGAMARWNTVFVEVPIETFAPVKTVLDLLRPEHQVGEE